MIRMNITNHNTSLRVNEGYEGERIETKIERVVTLNEPIKDGAPIIYTNRADGVQPQYDIRTDRFDVAIEAMDKTAKSYLARRDNKNDPEMKVTKGGESDDAKGGDGDTNDAKNAS